MDFLAEFDRQLDNLILKGYPKAANLSTEEFIKLASPLKEYLSGLELKAPDYVAGSLPFLIVVKSNLVKTEAQMSMVVRSGKNGVTKLFPHTSDNFEVIKNQQIPNSSIYLLVNIDRGYETLNVAPVNAFESIIGKKRLPLTIDEGVAIITHHPDFLVKNNCFSLLASRNPNDKRVPAIWINSKKEANLGWCWNGNPHTWLGSASASKRIS
jgi:hypothetical protein